MDKSSTREIPLRTVFLTIGDYLRNGLRFWWVLLLVGIAYGAYSAYTARAEVAVFPARLTFVLNEESGAGGAGGILGRLGLGGGGGGGGASPGKIIALAQSQQIMHNTLLDSVTIDGTNDRMANHMIRIYELADKWELPEGKHALVNATIETMTEAEKNLLKQLHYFVNTGEEDILLVKNDEETNIMTLLAKTPDQQMSLSLAYGVYENLSRFYTEESTGNSRATVERLQVKSDSVATMLSRAEYRLANMMDSRLGAMQRRDLVRRGQAEREVQILNLTYAEVLRNLETARFALSTHTPFFQTVDVPFTPLYAIRKNWKKTGFYGILTGAFLGFLLVSAGKFYFDVMRDPPRISSGDPPRISSGDIRV